VDHQGGLIGQSCLSANQLLTRGMVSRGSVWFFNAYEAEHPSTSRTCIPLPGDTLDFWHPRLTRNPAWVEEEWDGTDEHLEQKFFYTWYVVHATITEVTYSGAMVTVEADHPIFGPGWRYYGVFESFALVRPNETPERRRQIYEAWLCLKRLGKEVPEHDLVFTDAERVCQPEGP